MAAKGKEARESVDRAQWQCVNCGLDKGVNWVYCSSCLRQYIGGQVEYGYNLDADIAGYIQRRGESAN